MRTHAVRKLRAAEIKVRLALARQQGIAERQRRVRDVASADVERPGKRMRIADKQCVGTGQLGANALEFTTDRFTSKTFGIRSDCTLRRMRPVFPDAVDRVCLNRNEFGALGFELLPIRIRLSRRMHPWVETDALAFADVVAKPGGRRGSPYIDDSEKFGINLVARLQRVASIDENRGFILKHDRQSG